MTVSRRARPCAAWLATRLVPGLSLGSFLVILGLGLSGSIALGNPPESVRESLPAIEVLGIRPAPAAQPSEAGSRVGAETERAAPTEPSSTNQKVMTWGDVLQTSAASPEPPTRELTFPIEQKALFDPDVSLTACTSCGQFHSGSHFGGGSSGSCGPGGCVPGRSRNCHHAESATYVGRFVTNLYHCLCCPDPCYQPRWVPEANASFFVDPARPRTQKRLRWDHAFSMWFPDRSEYFWAREYLGPGPKPKIPTTRRGKPVYGERTLSYDQLYVYIEAALPRFSFFTEVPYRSTSPDLTAHHAGFADMNIGTKSLLLDCDLLQLTLQFKTYFPIGNVLYGLGNGHVSLEPSLLMAMHLAPNTYLQGQIAEWVPLGGDPDYAGAILHYHLSMNQLLCDFTPDVKLMGTLEFNGWSFQDGAFTAPILGPKKSSGDSYLSLGPGLRMSVCDFIDFGVGTAFALGGGPNWGNPLIRSEIRIFY